MKDSTADNKDRLHQIEKAINQVESFVTGISANEFNNNELISSAVLFQFSVIGEAIKHIDKNLLNKYSYPWYKVRSFRNLILHEYFRIELSAVWEVINKDLPELKEMIQQILDQEFKEN
jgi:uncharacterized protein with HEPN domain